MASLTIVALGFLLLHNASSFNFSPKPNLIIREPQLPTYVPKTRASYFGYSLILRPSSIFIGAPLAQSTFPSQHMINETGAVYRCDHTSGACQPFQIDIAGNKKINTKKIFDSERRDNQWLGGAMDGGIADSDKLLICAPRFTAYIYDDDYAMHGRCYWLVNGLSTLAMSVEPISPLRAMDSQYVSGNGLDSYYYAMAGQGLSAHVTPDSEECLMGAPGIFNWQGSVVHYADNYVNKSHVLYLDDWGSGRNAYMGYAVASGYFDSADPEHLLYIATAPRADWLTGEAYIYDVIEGSFEEKFSLHGGKFGEFFGYAVLAEDINGDGFTDIIISAPMYYAENSFDDGAIYVYINRGNFNFEEHLVLSPVLHEAARFGTTLSKLGDINHDGYNDIAVGAPYAGDGLVFIYLGGERGLREPPSQRLTSPKSQSNTYMPGINMFGHGLSKGCDIDNNSFNDFSIGAPNAETVYVYRAYPVVKINAHIRPEMREIRLQQKQFKVTLCYSVHSTPALAKDVEVTIQLVADPYARRVQLLEVHAHNYAFNVSIGEQQQCRSFDCAVHGYEADIFKPIVLEMHYDIVYGVPDSEIFCVHCAALDPAAPKVISEKIIFTTGCASNICVADLRVKSVGLNQTYTLCSSRTLPVTYEIENVGDLAYLPQINITSKNRLPYAKIPSNCKAVDTVYLLCDLNDGHFMAKNDKCHITVIYDVSNINGNTLSLQARVFSAGNEATPLNNKAIDEITLMQLTQIEATGIPEIPRLSLKEISNNTEIINNYQVRSLGPSTAAALDLIIHIPIAFKANGSNVDKQIIDLKHLQIDAVYNSQPLSVKYQQQSTNVLTSEKNIAQNYNEAVASLHLKRTIFFDCNNTQTTICASAVIRLYNFVPESSVTIKLKYSVNKQAVEELLKKSWEYFALLMPLDVTRLDASKNKRMTLKTAYDYTVITKQYSVSYWVYILSILGGLLALALLSYSLYKAGFFKRSNKEDWEKLIADKYVVEPVDNINLDAVGSNDDLEVII